MKKMSVAMDLRWLMLSLMILGLIFAARLAAAGTFYNCVDKSGEETLSDYPVAGQTCKPIQTHEAKTEPRENAEKWKHLASGVTSYGEKATRVIIRGNSVLVPATLAYGGNEVNVHFLLDTGASGTVIHANIADQLSINTNKASKAMGEVVGGGMVEASIVRMSSLTVGPYTFQSRPVFVVPYEGSIAKYDGLLGMDLLRELRYRVDFRRQIIVWD